MKYLSLFISLLVIQNVFGEEDPGLIEEANDIPEGKEKYYLLILNCSLRHTDVKGWQISIIWP